MKHQFTQQVGLAIQSQAATATACEKSYICAKKYFGILNYFTFFPQKGHDGAFWLFFFQ